MPVEILTAFVAGQALAIAAGVAVGAVKPVIALRLRAPVQGAASTGSRVKAETFDSGVCWYGRNLASLVDEAQAERASRYADGMTLAGVLASLPKARVVSDIPGRVRLRVKYLKGRTSYAQFTANALMSGAGIRQVKASSLTGSVLIYYDTEQFDTLGSLMESIVVGQASNNQFRKE